MKDLRERLIAAFRTEQAEHLQAVRAMLGEAGEGLDLGEIYRRIHSLKGAARVVGLRSVETIAHRLETLIAEAQGAPDAHGAVAEVVECSLDAIEDCVAVWDEAATPARAADVLAEIERRVGGARDAPAAKPSGTAPVPVQEPAPVGEPEPAEPARPAAPRPGPEDSARVDVATLDAVLQRTGDLLVEGARGQRLADVLNSRSLELRALVQAGGEQADQALRPLAEQLRRASQDQRDAAWRLRTLGKQLARDVRAMRIVAADSVFGGLRKMIRDLAVAEEKLVEVSVTGLAVRADRGILQALADPVMHLVRNAVSHGIEPAKERTAAGKPAAGRLAVRIAAERGMLTIRVEDDGPGLDRKRIAEEAARRGVAAPDEHEALVAMLLAPGFSTAALTEIAGRGIGLSVVDQAVRRLQGRFSIYPGPAGGLAAVITVPLAVTGSQLVVVRCGGQVYAIPAHGVERLVRAMAEQIITVQDEPMLSLGPDEDPVPLASLASLLGQGSAPSNGQELEVVILTVDGKAVALLIDALLTVQDRVVQQLDAALAGIEVIAGGVILDDGTVATVLNPPALMKLAREGRRDVEVLRAAQPPPAPPLILIVDDSITTRTLEKSVLEARGFRVRLSVDGAEALAFLAKERPDLVIADIEMPRVDGFALLHAMKEDKTLAAIPVILVTSRDSEEDRRKGLALGADAYIVKQRFDQRDLVDTIEQIL